MRARIPVTGKGDFSNPMSTVRSTKPSHCPHIVIVDDDADVREVVTRYFSSQNFRVSGARDGAELRAIIARDHVTLVLLDLGLPGEDGLSLTRFLREKWGGPVIIVSGHHEPVERVLGLEMGADDYVTKPFDLRELLARVRSVLRRTMAETANPEATSADFEFEGFRLDLLARDLLGPDGSPLDITTGEFELLRAFLEQPNRVLSRDRLLQHTRGREAGPFDRAIDVQVGRLRSKLRRAQPRVEFIKTVRGAGYIFSAPVRRR
jgi:two-component system, OmpR family, response regulator